MLLVGHGSKLPYNKELVEETADLIQRMNQEFIVKCGFMSLNEPGVEASLEAFRTEDIDLIVVVPVFLAKGVHILKDIPALLGLESGKNRGRFLMNGRSIPLYYADPIGQDPLLAELMLKNAYRVIEEQS